MDALGHRHLAKGLEDDWHSIMDNPKQRKKIQDRLAQRARRRCSSLLSLIARISSGELIYFHLSGRNV